MARAVVFMLILLIAYPAESSWFSERTREVTKKAALFYAQKTLPETFFRHAKWAPPVSKEAADIPRSETLMSKEEFERRFPPITTERALDIYYVVGVAQYLFAEMGIKALPVGGTMLGMLRNGGQLPHDDDADFAVLQESVDQIMANKKLFERYDLRIREIPGIGIQLYPAGDHGFLGMAYSMIHNNVGSFVQRHTGFDVGHSDLTKRGFIDVMPIRFYQDVQAYRYCAPEFAEEVWWQQVISRSLFEDDFEPHRFGPLSILAPEHHKALEAIEEVYPHSMAYAMRTPDHRQDQDIQAELVPLTEEQKKPFPLDESDLENLRQRFARVGLKIKEDGRIAPLAKTKAGNLKREMRGYGEA